MSCKVKYWVVLLTLHCPLSSRWRQDAQQGAREQEELQGECDQQQEVPLTLPLPHRDGPRHEVQEPPRQTQQRWVVVGGWVSLRIEIALELLKNTLSLRQNGFSKGATGSKFKLIHICVYISHLVWEQRRFQKLQKYGISKYFFHFESVLIFGVANAFKNIFR